MDDLQNLETLDKGTNFKRSRIISKITMDIEKIKESCKCEMTKINFMNILEKKFETKKDGCRYQVYICHK